MAFHPSAADDRRRLGLGKADPHSGWADAVAASAFAATGQPLLLTARDALPAATQDALARHGAPEALVVGGSGLRPATSRRTRRG